MDAPDSGPQGRTGSYPENLADIMLRPLSAPCIVHSQYRLYLLVPHNRTAVAQSRSFSVLSLGYALPLQSPSTCSQSWLMTPTPLPLPLPLLSMKPIFSILSWPCTLQVPLSGSPF